MSKTFYIIDGHAQIFRAYFAPFRDLTSPSGEPTKATFDPLTVDDKVVHFYEHTTDYELDAWAQWCGLFRPSPFPSSPPPYRKLWRLQNQSGRPRIITK